MLTATDLLCSDLQERQRDYTTVKKKQLECVMEQKLKENIFLCFFNLNHLISSEISQQMYIILKVSWVYVSYLVILKYFATQGLSQIRGFLKNHLP